MESASEMSDWENARESEDWEVEGSKVCFWVKEERSEEEEEEEGKEEEQEEGKEEVEGNDRISELSDAIVEDMLSLMPMIDAVKTSILSERWRWTWASITKLEFIYDEFNNSLERFNEFIKTTMKLHWSRKIHKFVLSLHYTDFMNPTITLCLLLSVFKKVEELRLDFVSYHHTPYLLPPEIYSCESMKKLSLNLCQISPTAVNWRSLRDLSIGNAFLDDHVIQMLLVGCPRLESLILISCGGYNNINSSTLRGLVIDFYENDHDPTWLEIDAPNLHSLELIGCMRVKMQRLRNLLSRLVHVTLTFSLLNWIEIIDPLIIVDNVTDVYQGMVSDLMKEISHAKYLTAGSWVVQTLSALELQKFTPSILLCKHLILEINLCAKDLPGINSLLRSSPILEKLVVDLSGFHDYEVYDGGPRHIWNFDAKDYWESKKLMLSQCLKTVEIIGYSSYVPKFAKFLLQHAQGLATMTFRKSKANYFEWQKYFGLDEDFFGIIQKLLSYPRSSPHAKILLE